MSRSETASSASTAPTATVNGKPLVGIVRSEINRCEKWRPMRRSPIAITSPIRLPTRTIPANTLTVRDLDRRAAQVHPEEPSGNWDKTPARGSIHK